MLLQFRTQQNRKQIHNALTYAVIAFLLWGLDKNYVVRDVNHAMAMDTHTSRTRGELELNSTQLRDLNEICDSESCKYFARTLLAGIEPSRNPCNDFYEFVCANTEQPLENIVKRKLGANIMSFIEYNDVKSVVEESKNLSRLRKLYASCRKPNPRNFEYLLALIRDLGGLPLAGSYSGWNDQSSFDWVEAIVNFRKLGLMFDQLFKFSVEALDMKFRLSIDVPDPNSARLFDETTYRNLLRSLYPELIMDFSMQLEEVLSFRFRLLSIIKAVGGETIYKGSIRSLIGNIPEIDWNRLILGISETHRPAQDHVILIELQKLKLIAELIGQTKPEVLANHLMLSIIENFARFVTIPGDGRRLSEQFPEPSCENLMVNKLGLALSVEYYHRFSTGMAIDLTRNMIENIKTEIKLMIEQAEWISSDKTKSFAMSKIDDLQFDIGIADKLVDPETSEWFYSGLELSSMNVIENLINIDRVKFDLHFNEINQTPAERYHWIDYDRPMLTAVHFNAHYSIDHKRVRINAGVLDPLFVDETRLASINHGIGGYLIAHEIMHVFELDGHWDDLDWLDQVSKRRCQRKARRLIRQYDGLQLDGADWKVNGRCTLIENIPDNVGIVAAFRAFRRWLDNHRHLPSLLNGIELNRNQLFWASYATRWCRIGVDESTYEHSEHSPARFRVNIPLSNSIEFSKDFRCPSGSRMNPNLKCIVC